MGLFRFPHAWSTIVPADSPLVSAVPLLEDRDRALEDYMATVPLGVLDYASTSVSQTGINAETDLTSLSVTVTVGTNRRVRITGQTTFLAAGGTVSAIGRIKESTTVLGRFGFANLDSGAAARVLQCGSAIVTPSAGKHTYKLSLEDNGGSGSVSSEASAENPAFILVEDIGRA